MIKLTARLIPDDACVTLLEDTFDEFARAAQWLQEHAPNHLRDRQALRQRYFNELKRETVLGTSLCESVLSVVAMYRKAHDMGIGNGLHPQKIIYYSNGISIQGRRASLLLLDGRQEIEFDLDTPEDYKALKKCQFRRADLLLSQDEWQLILHMAPTSIRYTPEGVSCA